MSYDFTLKMGIRPQKMPFLLLKSYRKKKRKAILWKKQNCFPVW